MKTLFNYSKSAIIWLLAVLLLFTFSTCQKDDDDDTQHSENVSGKWEFILTPDVTVPDTTIAHGYTGADFGESSAINDEVYLYEDEDGNILGYSGPFKLLGTISGKSVTLKVYINPDGDYNPVLPLSQMQLFSIMNLDINEYGFMSGTGIYEAYEEYPNIVNDTYFVEARMLSPIRNHKSDNMGYKNGMAVNHWYDFICKEIDKLVDWVAKDLTDGKLRPMDGCSLHKNGAGYYVLGHEGPGNDYDLFSTTIYYPYQWCRCGTRSYGFDISIKSENISIDDLITKIKSDAIKDLAKKMGFDIPDDLFFALLEFHNEFGGFGISFAYSSNTKNMSIYVNHLEGSSDDAKNHPLIQKIKSAMGKHANHVTVYAGHSIKDHFHLQRSYHFTCNTQLVITYLLGTHNVNYD